MSARRTAKKFLLILTGAVIVTAALVAGAYYFRTPLLLGMFGTSTCPVVVVSGTWEEMGYQIGSRRDIAVKTSRLAMLIRRSFSAEDAGRYYKKAEPFLTEDIKAQMKGFARGLADSLQVSYAQAWDTVLVTNFYLPYNETIQCTAVAVTSPEAAFLAHNSDDLYLNTIVRATIVIFNPAADSGPAFFSFSPLPVLAGVMLGENASGIAVAYNAACQAKGDYGLPPYIMVRRVMQECTSIEEVVHTFQSFIADGGRFSQEGSILTFIDFKTKQVARIEVASDRVEIDRGTSKDGSTTVVGANHYRMMPERNRHSEWSLSSYARFERAGVLLSMRKENTLQSILQLMSDHDGMPNGCGYTICCHRDLNFGTVFTHIFDDQFALHFIEGNPCRYGKDPAILQTIRWKEILAEGPS